MTVGSLPHIAFLYLNCMSGVSRLGCQLAISHALIMTRLFPALIHAWTPISLENMRRQLSKNITMNVFLLELEKARRETTELLSCLPREPKTSMCIWVWNYITKSEGLARPSVKYLMLALQCFFPVIFWFNSQFALGIWFQIKVIVFIRSLGQGCGCSAAVLFNMGGYISNCKTNSIDRACIWIWAVDNTNVVKGHLPWRENDILRLFLVDFNRYFLTTRQKIILGKRVFMF